MQHSKYKDPVNFTTIPNVIFDKWMCILSVYEFSVLLCICRHSLSHDDISDGAKIGDIEKRTSICRSMIKKSIKSLLEHGLIRQCAYDVPEPYPYVLIREWEINPNFPNYPDLEKLLSKKE